MATAELVACLPVLLLLLAVALGAVAVGAQRVRVQDAAREAARAAARGDDATAHRMVAADAPGAALDLATTGGDVTASVRVDVRPVSWLPGVTVSAAAVAAVEPGTDDAAPP